MYFSMQMDYSKFTTNPAAQNNCTILEKILFTNLPVYYHAVAVP